MKHFFFENCKDLSKLLNLEKLPEDTDTEDIIIKKLKRIYDAADIIYDRRIDPIDYGDTTSDLLQLLSTNRCGEIFMAEIRNVPDNYVLQKENDEYIKQRGKEDDGEDDPQIKQDSQKPYTIPQIKWGLLSLWNYVTNSWKESEQQHQCNPELRFFYYLTAGNIARRLSQSFLLIDSNFKEAEIWGERAFEMVWHSKIIAIKKATSFPTGVISDWKILSLLSEYNMGTCFQDYTNRNRRSNYSSAEDQYTDILCQIESSSSLINSATPAQRKQLFLIYTETLRHQITIQRRQRKKDRVICTHSG